MASLSEQLSSPLVRAFLITGISGIIAGFFIGKTVGSSTSATSFASGADDSDLSANEDDDELSKSAFNTGEECKLVLVVRTDLGMTKGKIAAQCSHATLACYKALKQSRAKSSQQILQRWERYGQAKVVVKVDSEEELEMLQAQAVSLNLTGKTVHDAGRTQIASGSATVLGVGPGPKSMVDTVTGELKLL